MMSSTLILPGDSLPLSDPHEMREQLEPDVDLVIDGGHCGFEPTTVVVLENGQSMIARKGKGDLRAFGAVVLPDEGYT